MRTRNFLIELSKLWLEKWEAFKQEKKDEWMLQLHREYVDEANSLIPKQSYAKQI